MAYIAPSTRSAGALITATIWNQDVVANPIAIYAGAMSIASQAANDIPYCSSATQFGRIAAAASAVLVTNGSSVPSLSTTLPAVDGSALTGLSIPIKAYAVTRADAVSTASETDIMTFTVPANTWADQDRVELHGVFLVKNNKGTSGTFTPKLYVGGVAVALTNTAQGDDVDESTIPFSLRLQRAGATVYMAIPGGGVNITALQLNGDVMIGNWAGTILNAVKTWTPTFTSNIIIKYSVTPSASHATFYVKPQTAIAHKFGA